MKKALVYYLYGTKNAGDMAICFGTVELLKQKGYKVTMVSRFSEFEQEYQLSKECIQRYYPDVEVYPGPFSFEREFSRSEKLKAYASSFLKVLGISPDNTNRKLIKENDIVCFNGGNLLRGENATDYLRLMALFYPIQLAKRIGKPVWCLPQSTAGLSNTAKRMLKHYFKGFREIFVREKLSYEQLTSEFPGNPFVLSTDLAFFCEDNEMARQRYRKQITIQPNGKRTALILRGTGIGDIGSLDAPVAQKMELILEDYVVNHPADQYYIVIQTLKDRELSEEFFHRIKDKVQVEIIENHDPLVLRELYKQMDLTVTMRLHAAILSLSARTPAAGIFSQVWGLKNPGIMAAYRMPYLIAEHDSNESLSEMISRIPADASKRIDQMILKGKATITLGEG